MLLKPERLAGHSSRFRKPGLDVWAAQRADHLEVFPTNSESSDQATARPFDCAQDKQAAPLLLPRLQRSGTALGFVELLWGELWRE